MIAFWLRCEILYDIVHLALFLASCRLTMEEVHKTSSSNSATPPQTPSLQGTALQAAQLSRVSQQVKKATQKPGLLRNILSRLIAVFLCKVAF